MEKCTFLFRLIPKVFEETTAFGTQVPTFWNTLGLPLGTGANESKSTKRGRRREERDFLAESFKYLLQ